MHVRRASACLRYREREPGRLQLRVVLRRGEEVCEIVVEEDAEQVRVLILLCGEIEDRTEAMDCPYSVYLDAPLADRRVVDIARGDAELDLFVPNW